MRLRASTVPNRTNARLRDAAGNPPRWGGVWRAGMLALRLASWMVITVCGPAGPGATVGGLKMAVAPAGSPEAESVTVLLNAPPRGGTLMLTVTNPPSGTSNGVPGALMV